MASLLKESELFRKSIFGDGATIKAVPMINILAASTGNPSALLNIVDCTEYLLEGGKKDVPYLAKMIMPQITKMEAMLDGTNCCCNGVMI